MASASTADSREMDLFVNPPAPRDYVEEGGLRYVRPYTFDFAAHVKPKWAGLSAAEALAREFPQRGKAYYERRARPSRGEREAR